MAFFSPAATSDARCLLIPPQTPAPSRTASFSESRTDEVAPAKKAKPAMPQGDFQGFQAPRSPAFPGPAGPAEAVEDGVDFALSIGMMRGVGKGKGLPLGLSWCCGWVTFLPTVFSSTPLLPVRVHELGRKAVEETGLQKCLGKLWEESGKVS